MVEMRKMNLPSGLKREREREDVYRQTCKLQLQTAIYHTGFLWEPGHS
jgi:hypothetical protein